MKILHECSDFLVLNKAAGTHSDQVIAQRGMDPYEWRLCHRLDLESSGCLLHCKAPLWPTMHELFTQSHSIQKLYYAASTHPIVHPKERMNKEGFDFIEGYICSRYRGSKKVRFSAEALGGYRSSVPVRHGLRRIVHQHLPKKIAEDMGLSPSDSIFEVLLLSGARHQIRAYFKYLNAPLCGDPLYGDGPTEHGLALHAWQLKFTHPHKPQTEILAQALERVRHAK